MNRNPFVESLTAELRSGCRNSAPPRVGLELEQFLAGPDGSAAPFSCGVDVLHRMRPFYTEEQRSGGWLIRMGRSDCVVRLGPGGQLSCCVPPQPGLMQLRRGLERFSFELENALAAEGLTAHPQGCIPESETDALPLLPEPGCSCLCACLSAAGPDGKRLLKGTASTCVTLDYADERDFSRKLAAACRLTPLLCLYAENTSDFGTAPDRERFPRIRLAARAGLPSSGFPAGAFDGMSFRDYALWLSRMPPFTLPEGDGIVCTGSVPNARLFSRRPVTGQDASHVLRSVYPWVRACGGLELRMADSLPMPRALAFAALCRGLLCDARNLARVEDAFGALGQRETEDILRRMRTDGENVPVAGRPAAEWLVILRLWAREALEPLEREMVMSSYEFI